MGANSYCIGQYSFRQVNEYYFIVFFMGSYNKFLIFLLSYSQILPFIFWARSQREDSLSSSHVLISQQKVFCNLILGKPVFCTLEKVKFLWFSSDFKCSLVFNNQETLIESKKTIGRAGTGLGFTRFLKMALSLCTSVKRYIGYSL